MAQKGKLTFLTDKCKGCSLCIVACPKNVLALADEVNKKGYLPVYAANPEECIACTNCGLMCPDNIITIERLS